MGIIFKIMSFLLLSIGAFFVYGAKYIAVNFMKGVEGSRNKNGSEEVPADLNSVGMDSEKGEWNEQIHKKILNSKMIGMAFIIAGVILVLVAFK
jgi:hypothetical protein